jgi:hypothetical protein
LIAYLGHRRDLSSRRGPFLSESRRNRADPITAWTWSKVVRGIALRADVPHRWRTAGVTRVVREATELVGLPLLDHIIVTDSGYYSFREAEGWED